MKCVLSNKNFTSDYVEQLINSRGGDFSRLVAATSNDIEDPDLLDNIGIGANLFKHFVFDDNSKIALVVDCDPDGYTSSAIIYLYIKQLNPNKEIIPLIHSGKQHGLEDTFEEIIQHKDISFVILPDASSSDYDFHAKLKEAGISILVLDHHLAEYYSPDAVVINNQLSERYKNKDLTGAGVTFQFCRYLDKVLNINYANNYIDLAALGIISDMGNILSIENFAIIKAGLQKLDKNYLFSELINKQQFSLGDISKIDYMGVAFYITPLINALIRVGTLEEKQKLFQAFIEGDKVVPSTKRGEKNCSELLATQVVRNCVNAKSKQDKLKNAAMDTISVKIFNNNLNENKILIVELDDDEDSFPSELNGLIAMNCTTKYKLPTLILKENEEGYLRGSARGLNYSELKSFKDYLDSTNLFEYNMGQYYGPLTSFPYVGGV